MLLTCSVFFLNIGNICRQEINVTETFVLLRSLAHDSEYCFQIDSYPVDSGGYWSQAVEYCATTGVRGEQFTLSSSISPCGVLRITKRGHSPSLPSLSSHSPPFFHIPFLSSPLPFEVTLPARGFGERC